MFFCPSSLLGRLWTGKLLCRCVPHLSFGTSTRVRFPLALMLVWLVRASNGSWRTKAALVLSPSLPLANWQTSLMTSWEKSIPAESIFITCPMVPQALIRSFLILPRSGLDLYVIYCSYPVPESSLGSLTLYKQNAIFWNRIHVILFRSFVWQVCVCVFVLSLSVVDITSKSAVQLTNYIFFPQTQQNSRSISAVTASAFAQYATTVLFGKALKVSPDISLVQTINRR